MDLLLVHKGSMKPSSGFQDYYFSKDKKSVLDLLFKMYYGLSFYGKKNQSTPRFLRHTKNDGKKKVPACTRQL